MAEKPIFLNTQGDPERLLPPNTVDPAVLGTGTPATSNFLRGDGVWTTVPTDGANALVVNAGVSTSATTLTLSNSNNVSFGMAGGVITATATFPSQTVQTQHVHDVSLAGNTSGTLSLVSSGTLVLIGGNNITLSQAGNNVTISGANTVAQSAQTQDRFNLSLSGNTAGVVAQVSSGTLTLAGGNNITLSQNGNAVTISGPNTVAQTVQTQHALDVALAGNTSGTLAQVSSGTLVLAGGNNITLSQAGNAVTISGPNTVAQTVQTQNLHNVTLAGNTSGTLAQVSSGTLSLAGGNNITLSQVGNAITISGPNTVAQSVQSLRVYQAGNTTGEASSGTFDARSISLSGAGIISVGMTNNQVVVSATTAAQTLQTQSRFNLSLSGNTSGTLALVSSGVLSLAGGNNITLSQAGNAVTISGPNTVAQTNQTVGLYQVGNTTGQSSSSTIDARSLSVSGAGIASVGMSGGQLVVSVTTASQTVQTQNLHNVTLGGNTSGTLAQISSGTLSLAGGPNITLSQVGNAVTISGPSAAVQSNQTIGLYEVGNTTGQSSSSTVDARSLSFSGAGLVSVGMSGGSVVVSATSAAQTVQTQSRFNLTLSGNTSGTLAQVSSGTLSLAGGNNITLSQVGNAVTISGPNTVAQTVQTQNLHNVTLSGNTSGTLAAVSSGTLTLAGGNNITLSQVGNAVTISGASHVPQTNQTIGLYGVGNTTGVSSSSTVDARTLSIRGSGIISVGHSNGSFVISATGSDQTNQTVGLYGVGNTTGQSSSSTVDARSISYDGAGIVSVGMSAGSLRISATVPAQTAQTVGVYGVGNTTGQSSSSTVDARSLSFQGTGNISVGMSGGSVVLSVSTAAQTVQTQNLHNVTLSGNTAGVMAQISSGTMSLAGGNNITLSQNGNAVTISGPNTVAQTNQTVGLYQVGNTTGQSSSSTVDARSISYDGAGIVSVGMSNGSLRISATTAAQTVQTQDRFNLTLSGNTAGVMAQVSSGVLSLAGGNNITLSQNGNAITISGGAAGAADGVNALAVNGGVSTVSTTLTLSDGNNVSFGLAAGVITASASYAAQTNQTVGLYHVGNTTGQSSSSTVDARSLSFSGAGNISVGMSGGSVVISQTGGAGGGPSAAAGTQTATSGTVVFSNSNKITFGMSNSSVITASFDPINIGMSTNGNTAGTTGTFDGAGLRYILIGGNNITLRQSSNGSSVSLTISGPNTVAQSNQSAIKALGVSNTGQTAGNTGVSTGVDWVLAGSQSITLSQSTAVGGPNTVWFQHPAWLTTARASTDAVGLNTAQSNVTWSVNSGGISLDARGYAGTGTTLGLTNINASATLNSNGLNLALSISEGSDSWFATGANTIAGTNTSGAFNNDQYIISGAGGVSVGVSSNTLIISGGGGVINQTGPNIAAGTQTATSGTIVFSNSNNISFGMSNSSIVTAALANSTWYATGANTVAGKNTSGTVSHLSQIISGQSGVSVGVSNDTLIIQGNATQQQFFEPYPRITGSSTSSHTTSYYFNPFNIQEDLAMKVVVVSKSMSAVIPALSTANSSCSITQVQFHGVTFFSRQDYGANSSNLVSVASGSWAVTASLSQSSSSASFQMQWVTDSTGGVLGFSNSQSTNTSWASALTGYKAVAIPLVTTLTAGEYWMAHRVSSAATTGGGSSQSGLLNVSNFIVTQQGSLSFGTFGQASAASKQLLLGAIPGAATGTTGTMSLSAISTNTQHLFYMQMLNATIG